MYERKLLRQTRHPFSITNLFLEVTKLCVKANLSMYVVSTSLKLTVSASSRIRLERLKPFRTEEGTAMRMRTCEGLLLHVRRPDSLYLCRLVEYLV